MARPSKRDEDKKENLSGWSVTSRYAREIEAFAMACRMTRSESLDMMIGHSLHDFDRQRYLKELKEELSAKLADVDMELTRMIEYDTQNRILASALFRRYYHNCCDKRGNYKHDPIALNDYIQSILMPRCPGITYDVAVEIFKATYEDITNKRIEGQNATDKARFDALMGAAKDAKDERTGKAGSPDGDKAQES